MLLFNCSNINGEPPMFRRDFWVLGDGAELQLTVDLEKAPVAMNFVGGKYPKAVFVDPQYPVGGLEVAVQDGSLMFCFEKAIEKYHLEHIRLAFYY